MLGFVHPCFIHKCLIAKIFLFCIYFCIKVINMFFFLLADLLGDLLKQKPRETDGVESVIVVDGVPQVGPERLEKLTTVINKIFSKFGTIVNEYYPTNENGQTKG
jgi:hypothetical protein